MSEPMPGAGSEGVHFAGYLEWMRDELIVAASLQDIEEDVPLDLRWLGFHVLTEYARHAGHLDIVVELAESST